VPDSVMHPAREKDKIAIKVAALMLKIEFSFFENANA
jgi:hypothetical protein